MKEVLIKSKGLEGGRDGVNGAEVVRWLDYVRRPV